MNIKRRIIILLLGCFVFQLNAIEFWSFLNPIMPFVATTCAYIKCISDYFIPASRADLQATKKEIFNAITHQRQKMQEETNTNIDLIITTNKSELQATIDKEIMISSVRLARLRKCFATAQEVSTKKIAKNHAHLMKTLKTKLDLTLQVNKKELECFIKKALQSTDTSHQKLLGHLIALKKKLTTLKEDHENLQSNTIDVQIKKLLHTAFEQHSQMCKKNCAALAEDLSQHTKKFQETITTDKEKIKKIHTELAAIKKRNQEHIQAIEDTLKRVTTLNARFKALLYGNETVPSQRSTLAPGSAAEALFKPS